MRTEAISANAACRASPSVGASGPNFHSSPCSRSNSAKSTAHSSASAPPPAAGLPVAVHRITARTGRSLARLRWRIPSTERPRAASCPGRVGRSTQSRATTTVLRVSWRLLHLGTSCVKVMGWNTSFASSLMPGTRATRGSSTTARQRQTLGWRRRLPSGALSALSSAAAARACVSAASSDQPAASGALPEATRWPCGSSPSSASRSSLGRELAAAEPQTLWTTRPASEPSPSTANVNRYCTSSSTSGTWDKNLFSIGSCVAFLALRFASFLAL
mmetsp:Transcript_97171/g.256543  ORF Transcript_97171/g.256543 Transcript_97171/m.256543 type:complete len:274 (+) Transcript_97171:292-1113(+)